MVPGEFSKQIVPNRFVEHVASNIASGLLKQDLETLIQDHGLQDARQISLTSLAGENDFTCSVGRIAQVKYPERAYKTPLKCLAGTYIEEIIHRYPEYYRWRALIIPSRQTYSIHSDSINNKKNYRLHIPVVTNPQSYLTFFQDEKSDNYVEYRDALMVHLRTNNAYRVNTTGLHSAVNHGAEDRVHLVAVKYE